MRMTFGEALAQGYHRAGWTYQQGYVSRKVDKLAQPVQVAGGKRRGELYVLLPAFETSRYCIRQYLTK